MGNDDDDDDGGVDDDSWIFIYLSQDVSLENKFLDVSKEVCFVGVEEKSSRVDLIVCPLRATKSHGLLVVPHCWLLSDCWWRL